MRAKAKRMHLGQNKINVVELVGSDQQGLVHKCEQLRVALEDALHGAEALKARLSELENEGEKLNAMNVRLLNETAALNTHQEQNEKLLAQIAELSRNLEKVQRTHEDAFADLSSSRDELRVTNEELATANEELESSNSSLVSYNDELEAANQVLEGQRTETQKLNADLNAILDTTEALILETDMRGRIVAFNRRCELLTGYSADEVRGKSAIDLLVPKSERADVRRVAKALRSGSGGNKYENDWLTRDGKPLRIAWSNTFVKDDRSGRQRVLATGIDVTGLRQAERAVRTNRTEIFQLMRMSTVNEMGSLMAHELGQPLSAIVSYADTCKDIAQEIHLSDKQLVETIEKIAVQAHRASKMISRFRGIAKGQRRPNVSYNLNRVVQKAVGFIRPDAQDQRVSIDTNLAAKLPGLRGDRLLLEQVFINLVRNAMDSIVEHGSRRRRILVETAIAPDDHVEVVIKDTGGGLPAGFHLTPYQQFTTGKRTGLGIGLLISRSIVEQHGGVLSAAPRRGGGAVFRVTLPTNRNRERHE